MVRFVGIGSLDQRTNRGRGGIERRDLVVLNHFPETARIGIGRHTFKYHLRQSRSQWAVGNIGVARDPAHVGRAPEHIAGFGIKGPLHRELGPQQIAARRMLHALGLAG